VIRPITPEPLEPVARPVMIHRWEALAMLHWPYAPEVVQPVLPPALAVDMFEGSAWVGLVPFRMRIRMPSLPFVPWLSTFPETNVRTYVVGPDGRRGIWFLSLDIPRLGAVIAARATYRLPYHWAGMRMAQQGELVRYGSSRRWPGSRGAGGSIDVRAGEPIAVASELEHFLTARWGLYAPRGTGIAYAPVEHGRWPLRRAEALRVNDSLVPAARLPAPEGEPHVLYSTGVEVRIGRPRRIA
jgi:uncharacterized protein YqjF (DUF2071 family)